MLFYGIGKLLYGVDFVEAQLIEHRIPGFLAYAVLIGELLAPLMIIFGYQTRLGAILIIVNMIAATVLVHPHQILALGVNGGWALDLQAFFLLTALSLIFLGPGRYKLKN